MTKVELYDEDKVNEPTVSLKLIDDDGDVRLVSVDSDGEINYTIAMIDGDGIHLFSGCFDLGIKTRGQDGRVAVHRDY